jgi:putative membrane protein insertion efficiency factor
VVALGLLVGLVVFDLQRSPRDQLSARTLVGAIRVYRATLSPRLPSLGVRCRFAPSCSRYAEAAILESGAARGTLRAAWRILRCGPWTPPGTLDAP